MNQQLDFNFPRSSGLAFGVSPRKVAMRAKRELTASVKSGSPREGFALRRHVERIALLGELQQQYHRARRYGQKINRTPEGRRVRKTINDLVVQVVSESRRLCG